MQCQLTSSVHVPVQALVEQCAAAGRVGDVERCVLRLDLATLDFNQVLSPSLALLVHTRNYDIFGSSAASTPFHTSSSLLCFGPVALLQAHQIFTEGAMTQSIAAKC